MNLENIPVENKKKIKINFDDDCIDDLLFKVADKGLGFHHQQDSEKIDSFLLESKNCDLEILDKNKNIKGPILESIKIMPIIKNDLKTSNLSQKDIEDTKITNLKLEKNIEKISNTPSMGIVLLAWLIDVFIILISFVVVLTFLALAFDSSLFGHPKIIQYNDTIIFFSISFILFYLIYFSMFDIVSSPGKSLFNIRVMSLDGKNIKMKNAFLRSFITVISGIAFFLPLLMDFHGKLSDTKLEK